MPRERTEQHTEKKKKNAAAAADPRSLEREPQSALHPPPRHVGALLDEAVDDYAVAVDSRVLVVEGVDESLGQVEQALEVHTYMNISYVN